MNFLKQIVKLVKNALIVVEDVYPVGLCNKKEESNKVDI